MTTPTTGSADCPARAVFRRDDSLFFKRRHVDRAHAFYARYGPKTVVLARFMPIVRTFAPLVAGVGRMDYRTFLDVQRPRRHGVDLEDVVLGFLLGRYVPGVARHIELVILA